jgi:hypothetical protein
VHSASRAVCSRCPSGHAEATRELLALRIIEIAQLGERDRSRLRDDVLAYLARTNLIIERARMQLAYREDPSFFAVAPGALRGLDDGSHLRSKFRAGGLGLTPLMTANLGYFFATFPRESWG